MTTDQLQQPQLLISHLRQPVSPPLPHACLADEVYLLGNAPVVTTLEVSSRITLGTVLWQFVAIVSTVVLAITEQPLRDAAVVSESGTPLPSSCAVPLPASN